MTKEKTDVLSKENANCLKGVFAVFVLSHHIWQKTGFAGGMIAHLTLGNFGYLAVAVFFFLSGYGMMLSYKKQGINYPKNLLRRRIVPFYILSLLFALTELLFTKEITFGWKLPYAFGFIGNFWYLEIQLLIYIFFWLAFRTELPDKVKVIGFSVAVLSMMCVCNFLALGNWWMFSTACVIFGVVWAAIKGELENTILEKRRYPLFLILISAMFVFFMYNKTEIGGTTLLLCATLAAICFILLVFMIGSIIPFNNTVTRFLGKISLEIYVLQNVVMLFFKGGWTVATVHGAEIKNPWIYCVAVICGTIAISAAIHPFVSWFMSRKIWGVKR